MFLGHLAVAFAAPRLAPRLPLPVLVAAAQLPDLIWPNLVLLGIETVRVAPGITAFTPLDFVAYPWSHSLVANLGWAALVALAWWAWRRDARGAWVLAAVVLSHWVLDAVSHRPDLPLALDGQTKVGLGLWESVTATLAVELAGFALAVALYRGATVPRRLLGSQLLAMFVAFLLLVYFAAAFGPPPPSDRAVAWSAQAVWLLVAFAWWVDRERLRREPAR
jgi:hypothetical protein